MMGALKKYPITIGLLFGLATMVGTVACVAIRAQSQVTTIAEQAVSRHEQRDLETSHPGTKRLHDRLDRIDESLRDARESLKRIEGNLQR
jgi:hypothetical protein